MKAIWLLIFNFLFSYSLFAQSDPAHAILSRGLKEYYSESIHLTFNQPKYAAGDTIYFTGILLDRKKHKLIGGRRIGNVFLADKSGNILHERILFRDGLCNGHLVVPIKMTPGLHRVVAFTDDHDVTGPVFAHDVLIVGKFETRLDDGVSESGSEVRGKNGDLHWSANGTSFELAYRRNTRDQNEKLYVALNQYEHVYWTAEIKTGDRADTLDIPLQSIPAGSSTILILTDSLEPVEVFNLNNPIEKASLRLDLSRDSMETRDSLTLELGAISNSPDIEITFVSVSVLKEDLFFDGTIPGKILQVTTVPNALWPAPMKENKADRQKPSKNYPYYFKGRAVYSDNSRRVEDSTLLTFYLHKEDFIYGVYTRGEGAFTFPLFKEFEDDEVFFVADNKGKLLKNVKLVLDEPVSPSPDGIARVTGTQDAYNAYAEARSKIVESYTFYQKNSERKIVDSGDETEGDYRIDLKKFERFASMAEVLSNIVSLVRYQNSGGVEGIRIFLKKISNFSKADPVYIIDGIMTDNTSYFLGLNPEQVSEIRILRTPETLNRYGSLGKNGILVVNTTIRNHGTYLARSENSFFVKGINPMYPFKNDAKTNQRIPDLRVAIFWDPFVALQPGKKTSMKIHSGDATGKFVVIVKGFQASGQPIQAKTTFQVRH
jgi:hypothetical protein